MVRVVNEEGMADVYPRFGPTMEWDTAAGQAIVEQAEGSVIDIQTREPLGYNKRNLLNPFFIVTGQNPRFENQLIEQSQCKVIKFLY